jgi:thiamine biosynthesis lipoprotein
MIDIGGEVLAKGKNQKGKYWRIGINTPREDALLSEINAILTLKDMAVATSGNYRNFYTLSDGTKVSHTINPKTGFPERNQLLSASIVTGDCGWADGMATACMAMGLEGAKKLIANREELEGILIYAEGGVFKTFISEGLLPFYSEP